jgi:hypothetical protein
MDYGEGLAAPGRYRPVVNQDVQGVIGVELALMARTRRGGSKNSGFAPSGLSGLTLPDSAWSAWDDGFAVASLSLVIGRRRKRHCRIKKKPPVCAGG